MARAKAVAERQEKERVFKKEYKVTSGLPCRFSKNFGVELRHSAAPGGWGGGPGVPGLGLR